MTDTPVFETALGADAEMARLRQQAQQAFPADLWWHCDDHAVASVRPLLHTAARAGAHEATPTGAARLKMRRLVMVAPAPAPAPASAAPAPGPAAAARQASPAPAAAAGTFEVELDVAAMVAVLQQAARDGVPFCEECARAAAAAEA